MQVAEELLVGFAAIQRGVMFPRHESHGFDLELTHDVTKFGHPVAPYLPVVGGLSEIAGEDKEIRLLVQSVDGSHCLLQRPLGIRIDVGSVKTPMGVGELNKIEGFILLLC